MKRLVQLAFATSALSLAPLSHAHVDHDEGDSAIGTAIEAAFAEAEVEADAAPGSFRDVLPGFNARAAFDRTGTPIGPEAARLGAWSAVEDWPVLPVHAALLPNGKVLAWDATPDDFGEDVHTADRFETRVTVWDPVTNTHIRANNDTDTDLFCAGSAHLWDGRVLFAGGDGGKQGKNGPLSNSNLYDPWSNTWSRTDDLIAPRWYSSVAALGTGEMLTFGGAYTPTPIAEVFGHDKRWRGLPIRTQYTFSGDYSWLQATSDGDVMYFGPHDTLSRLDTSGEGIWTRGASRDDEGYRGYGSYAVYDTDRVLIAGGGDSLASAVVVDTKSGTATPTSAMSHGRRQHNLTVLADGGVLATGGNSTGANTIDLDGGVFEPELWDPASGTWTTLAPHAVDRQYHSIALLLADGRVLTGGGGYCPLCSEFGYHEQNVEIFSPPYLFAADGSAAVRPRVGTVPALADYAERIEVTTPDAARIRHAHLIRPGSVTHSQNQEQRLVPLEFTAGGNALSLTMPANRDIAPPGHYLLFLVDADGTPSVGEIVQIGQPSIRPSEVVTNRLQAGRPDYYAIEGKGSHRLSISLRGADSDVALFVDAGRMPAVTGPDGGGFASCLVVGDATSGKRCDVSGPVDTTWYVGVSGAAGTEYALIAHLGDTAVVPTPSLDTAEPDLATRVTGLAASGVTDREATLDWLAPAGMEAVDGYEIWRDGLLIAYRKTPGFSAGSLIPETSYRYHVVAVATDLARGAPSRTLVVTTSASEGTYADRYTPYIPTQPTGLRNERYSSTAVELFWQASFDNGVVTSYEVWRDGVLVGSSGGLSYYEGALENDTDHSWYVIAVDDEGNRSAPSAATSTAMPDPVEPTVDGVPTGGTSGGGTAGGGTSGYGTIGGGTSGEGTIAGDTSGEGTSGGFGNSGGVTPDASDEALVDGADAPTAPATSVPVTADATGGGSGGGGGGTSLVLLLGLGGLVAARRRVPAAAAACSLAFLVSACSGGSGEPVDVAGPDADRPDTADGSSTDDTSDSTPPRAFVPDVTSPDDSSPTTPAGLRSFLDVPSGLGSADGARAELVRTACFADYTRLRDALGGDGTVELFHTPDAPSVDVEWLTIEDVVPADEIDALGRPARRQGAGAVFDVRTDLARDPVCTVAPYETFDLAVVDGEPRSTYRVANVAMDCAPDSTHPQVETGNLALFVVEDGERLVGYGTRGKRYLYRRGFADEFETSALVRIERTERLDGTFAGYAATCGTIAPLPNGDSILVAPPATNEPGATTSTDEPPYAGRTWRSAARLGQDAVDALGLRAIRARAERAADALGLHEADAVERECPGGGSARATSETDDRREEHRHEFVGCTLADGSTIDGLYDVVRGDNGNAGGSTRQSSVEEFFALTSVSATHRLEVGGTLSDALSVDRADECGLVTSEAVLRIDVPTMRVDDVDVEGLAIEDITTVRIEPDPDGASCGREVAELAYSDSARVTDRANGAAFEISVNRTGAVLREEASGRTRSPAGSDLRIRIYHPGDDASLDLSPLFDPVNGTAAGAAVTIDDHPGRVDFVGDWDFLSGLSSN